MDNNISFKTTKIANEIRMYEKEITQLFIEAGYDEDAKSLKKQMESVSSEEQIRIVFIGQYTAGKSTIISALTSNKEIVIDSDIATCDTADYSWNGVTLTDTPGLYTENTEHDEKTKEMIKKSDLLVYCITSDLFNQYTKADFEKWAFESGYAGKMFLVVNKMSKEAGDYDELIGNYSETLNRSLMPHSVDEFSYSFVDAKDYKDGMDEHNMNLISYSHFEEFITRLNGFVKQKGLLGKMDTPIMILKAAIDAMTEKIINDDSNRAYNMLLSRMEKKIDQQRNQVYIEANNIIRRGLRVIADKGYELSTMIGNPDMVYTEDDINELVANTCDAINKKLEVLCTRSLDQLNCEIEQVLNSSTAAYFFNYVSKTYDGKKHIFGTKQQKINDIQIESIKKVVEQVSDKIIEYAVKDGAEAAGFFIKSTEAAGSSIHQAVLTVGQHLGHSFKPWEAVNIAKNIGNAAKVASPILTAVGVAMDIKQTIDEERKDMDLQRRQFECRQSFENLKGEIEKAYADELIGMYEVFDDANKKIADSRKTVQKQIKANDTMTQKLLAVRDDLVSVQQEIFE